MLKLFASKSNNRLIRLPSGSFTLDPAGNIIASTLPTDFPTARVKELGALVLKCFRGASHAQLPLQEVIICFAALKITARELRGGAIIYLAPQTFKHH